MGFEAMADDSLVWPEAAEVEVKARWERVEEKGGETLNEEAAAFEVREERVGVRERKCV